MGVVGGIEVWRGAQLEGVAVEPAAGAETDAAREVYFAAFPDGRGRASSRRVAYFVVTPTWVRHSDFRAAPPAIVEMDLSAAVRAADGAGGMRGPPSAGPRQCPVYWVDAFARAVGQGNPGASPSVPRVMSSAVVVCLCRRHAHMSLYFALCTQPLW